MGRRAGRRLYLTRHAFEMLGQGLGVIGLVVSKPGINSLGIDVGVGVPD